MQSSFGTKNGTLYTNQSAARATFHIAVSQPHAASCSPCLQPPAAVAIRSPPRRDPPASPGLDGSARYAHGPSHDVSRQCAGQGTRDDPQQPRLPPLYLPHRNPDRSPAVSPACDQRIAGDVEYSAAGVDERPQHALVPMIARRRRPPRNCPQREAQPPRPRSRSCCGGSDNVPRSGQRSAAAAPTVPARALRRSGIAPPFAASGLLRRAAARSSGRAAQRTPRP